MLPPLRRTRSATDVFSRPRPRPPPALDRSRHEHAPSTAQCRHAEQARRGRAARTGIDATVAGTMQRIWTAPVRMHSKPAAELVSQVSLSAKKNKGRRHQTIHSMWSAARIVAAALLVAAAVVMPVAEAKRGQIVTCSG